MNTTTILLSRDSQEDSIFPNVNTTIILLSRDSHVYGTIQVAYQQQRRAALQHEAKKRYEPSTLHETSL